MHQLASFTFRKLWRVPQGEDCVSEPDAQKLCSEWLGSHRCYFSSLNVFHHNEKLWDRCMELTSGAGLPVQMPLVTRSFLASVWWWPYSSPVWSQRDVSSATKPLLARWKATALGGQGGRAGDQELKVEQIPPSEQLLPAARAPGSSRVRFKTDRGRKCTVKVGAARMPPVAAEKNRLFKGQV